MKIVLGEAKEEYDTDVQMAVTRQLILRVNTEIKPEEAYVVSEITYSRRTGYSYTLINTQTKERRTTNLIRPLSKRFGVGFYKDDVRMMLMPEPEFKRLCEGAQNIVKKEEVKKIKHGISSQMIIKAPDTIPSSQLKKLQLRSVHIAKLSIRIINFLYVWIVLK